MPDKEHFRKLIETKRRRLRKLQEQRAYEGRSTDPEILMEIEDIEAEIGDLQTQLKEIEDRLEPSPQQDIQEQFSPVDDSTPDLVIESPYGTVRPNSPFYIKRMADTKCRAYFDQPYATTVFVQAPRQMGKSSLMHKVIANTKEKGKKKVVFIDFQKFSESDFKDEENFLIQLCLMVSRFLNIPEAIDKFWNSRLTNIIKCSDYLSHYIIPHFDAPLILAMDEVERVLTCPFRDDFFGMMRTWHNDRVYDDNFAKIDLFISSSTEPYLFITSPDQSPFNVAEPIYLQDFTRTEVEELNNRHISPLTPTEVSDLIDLLAGHPFLTRLSLYLLKSGQINVATLFAQATEDTGPFADHLSRYLLKISEEPELKEALIHICRYHTYEENQMFHRLKGAGLVKKAGRQVVFRNELYSRYFEDRLYG